MDFHKQDNNLEMNNHGETRATTKVNICQKPAGKNYLFDEPIKNNLFEKLGKIENLQIQHHTCDNTTGESKTNYENDRFEAKDQDLNLESIAAKEIEESQKTSINNLSYQTANTRKNSYFGSLESKITFPLLGRKIFRIKKYTKYNKYLNEICTDSEITDEEKNQLKDPQSKKISPFSKVNFSKLKVEEKDERLKNLAKLVKRLRRKVRNLENKVRFNASKLLNKYVWTKLGINTKNKYVPPEFSFDFDKICRALKRVRNHDDFEFSDQKHLIENLINLIAEDKLKLDSLGYKRICSQIRMLLNKEQIKYISKKNSKVTITFPETEVYITRAEYNKVKKFKDKEDILRAVLGVYDEQEEKAVKISIEAPSQLKPEKESIQEENKTEKKNIVNEKQEVHTDEPQLEKPSVFQDYFRKPETNKINLIEGNPNLFNNTLIQEKLNLMIKNQIENDSMNKPPTSNKMFENIPSSFSSFKNVNCQNDKPFYNNERERFNSLNNNFVFKSPMNNSNFTNFNNAENPSQQAFPFNFLQQNSNQLLGLNCLNGYNPNMQKFLNPMQLLMMNNNNQGVFNQNPDILSNLLMNQKIQQIPNQGESNLFANGNNGFNNNFFIKSPKKNNIFGDNLNNFNDPTLKSNNLFANKEKKDNSYNVFLK